MRHAGGRSWGIQPHPEIDVEEGSALQASYLVSMPERREVLEAGWHPEPRDDRITAAVVRAFLEP